MKFKLKSFMVIFVLIFFTLSLSAGNTTKIKRVGDAPLLSIKRGKSIDSVDQLKELVKKYSSRIEEGLQKAEAGFLFQPLMDSIENGKVNEKAIPVGTHLEWMLFYSGRKVKQKADVEWAGKAPLDVFCIPVQKDCKDYHVVIPKACGNITLADVADSKPQCDLKVSPALVNPGETVTVDVSGSKCVTETEVSVYYEGNKVETHVISASDAAWKTSFKDPGNYEMKVKVKGVNGIYVAAECSAKVYVNNPPSCDLKVSPEKVMVGKVVSLDASGSSDKDGKVEKAEFTILRKKDNSEVDKNTITAEPFVWKKKFKKAGEYKVFLKVADNHGAYSANNCEFDLRVEKRLFFLVEGGLGVAKGTYTTLAFLRGGIQYYLIPSKLSAVAVLGGAFVFNDDPFNHHFLSSFVLNGHFGKFFLGAGFGFSSSVRDLYLHEGDWLPEWKSDFDLVLQAGVDVLETPTGKGSIFVELRAPMGSEFTFEHYHEILLGFRLAF
ncbi:MAG: hypothetical protein ABFR75_02355 [Acidobacteriota bacterium]